MMLRDVPIGWGWEVYVEMFLAGIAAGAYLTAAILEFYGRGRSPIARAAHWISLPLVLVATFLLVMKLERSERFWHMIIQSEQIPMPMFKWWSPISIGAWGLMAFSAFTAVSFLDAVIARDWFRLGPWRPGRLLHGSLLGKIWMAGGAPLALFVAGYSGALLSVNAVPGWQDTGMTAAFFIALSVATGTAALLLIEAFRGNAPPVERESLEWANTLMVGWQLVMLLIFAISLGGALRFFVSLRATLAIVAGIILGGIAPLAMRFGSGRRGPRWTGGIAALVLVGGFLLRYAVVMGPQHVIEQ